AALDPRRLGPERALGLRVECGDVAAFEVLRRRERAQVAQRAVQVDVDRAHRRARATHRVALHDAALVLEQRQRREDRAHHHRHQRDDHDQDQAGAQAHRGHPAPIIAARAAPRRRTMEDWRNIRNWSREQMLKRVARFRKLKGSDGGLPDSPLPECRRKLYAVIGFPDPGSNEKSVASPVGQDASAMPAISIAEGFNLGYCKARPGKGPLMHNHDSNETFIPMTGRWRCEWNEGEATEHVDLNPLDVISFPTGVARRFMNVTYD